MQHQERAPVIEEAAERRGDAEMGRRKRQERQGAKSEQEHEQDHDQELGAPAGRGDFETGDAARFVPPGKSEETRTALQDSLDHARWRMGVDLGRNEGAPQIASLFPPHPGPPLGRGRY